MNRKQFLSDGESSVDKLVGLCVYRLESLRVKAMSLFFYM